MKDLAAKFGWSVITRNIDDLKDPGNNLVNIFTSLSPLKREHVKKQAYQYWGPADGNYCPYVLMILDVDPAAQYDDRPRFFAQVCIEIIAKGIQAHISKSRFQYFLLERQDFEWYRANGYQKWHVLVILLLITKKNNPTTQVGIYNLKDAIEQATL